MKHIHTFESFLNEKKELNEGRRPAKVKIPANVATVVKKIMKENPWERGKEISEVIEKNWPDIVETAKMADNQEVLRVELSKKEYILEICKQIHLADFYFVGQLMKNYF